MVTNRCTYRQVSPLAPFMKHDAEPKWKTGWSNIPAKELSETGLTFSVWNVCIEVVPVFHQCLVSIKSARRLSLFRVSYPTTMSTDVGREEIMRADSPLVIPQTPSSTSSCLNVSITEDRPSTWNRQHTVESTLIAYKSSSFKPFWKNNLLQSKAPKQILIENLKMYCQITYWCTVFSQDLIYSNQRTARWSFFQNAYAVIIIKSHVNKKKELKKKEKERKKSLHVSGQYIYFTCAHNHVEVALFTWASWETIEKIQEVLLQRKTADSSCILTIAWRNLLILLHYNGKKQMTGTRQLNTV